MQFNYGFDDGVFEQPDLDEEFPLGDGTAQTDAAVECPYCGETVEIGLDPGGGSRQEYVEDCQVCCRPWTVCVAYDDAGGAEVSLEPADGS
ncbi:MAG: Cysteine-rich protein [Gemmatimonadetes bacterium]|nr:Cysteine-rich protein [Gemmatimonadota bacterium]